MAKIQGKTTSSLPPESARVESTWDDDAMDSASIRRALAALAPEFETDGTRRRAESDRAARPTDPSPPGPAGARAEPEKKATSEEPATEALRRELADRYAVGDFSGALERAEELLRLSPDDPEAQRYATRCRDVLVQMFTARLGHLNQRVAMSVAPDQIRWLSMDHRAGFLLSLVDGASTIEELLDISGMPRLDALRMFHGLHEQRIITFAPADR